MHKFSIHHQENLIAIVIRADCSIPILNIYDLRVTHIDDGYQRTASTFSNDLPYGLGDRHKSIPYLTENTYSHCHIFATQVFCYDLTLSDPVGEGVRICLHGLPVILKNTWLFLSAYIRNVAKTEPQSFSLSIPPPKKCFVFISPSKDSAFPST